MTSDRSYRKALPAAYAKNELIRGSGEQFDPELVDFCEPYEGIELTASIPCVKIEKIQ